MMVLPVLWCGDLFVGLWCLLCVLPQSASKLADSSLEREPQPLSLLRRQLPYEGEPCWCAKSLSLEGGGFMSG